jgi:hypothetical protein
MKHEAEQFELLPPCPPDSERAGPAPLDSGLAGKGDRATGWKTPAHRLSYQRAAQRRYKETVLDHYGHKCDLCTVTDSDMLTVDHIAGDGAAHRRRCRIGAGRATLLWLIRNDFPPGFRLLCFNHQAKERIRLGIPTGRAAKKVLVLPDPVS